MLMVRQAGGGNRAVARPGQLPKKFRQSWNLILYVGLGALSGLFGNSQNPLPFRLLTLRRPQPQGVASFFRWWRRIRIYFGAENKGPRPRGGGAGQVTEAIILWDDRR